MTERDEQGPFPGKCTVHGSDYWPDTTLGGRVGGKPPYRGADIVCTAPSVYGRVLDLLLAPYCDAPNQGEILQGLSQILTEDEGARVDAMRCIGCGLCVTKCNFGALKLTTRIPGDTSSNRACDYQKRDHI